MVNALHADEIQESFLLVKLRTYASASGMTHHEHGAALCWRSAAWTDGQPEPSSGNPRRPLVGPSLGVQQMRRT